MVYWILAEVCGGEVGAVGDAGEWAWSVMKLLSANWQSHRDLQMKSRKELARDHRELRL
jgi:hypothetical protein